MINDKNLNERVNSAKVNDKELNDLLVDYKPFIISILSKNQGRYIDTNNEDLITIGMLAFEETIKKYNEKNGAFLGFASKVIKLRSIDYYRKESKFKNHEIYLDNDYTENESNSLLNSVSIENYNEEGSNNNNK